MVNGVTSIETFKQILDEHKKYISDVFKDSQNYNSFVISIGYAGFFTVFSAIKNYLTKNEIFWVCILISISVAVFIVWEICKMIFMSILHLLYAYSVKKEPTKFFEKQKELSDRIFELNKCTIPIWIGALVITSSTGFISLLIILRSLIIHFIK